MPDVSLLPTYLENSHVLWLEKVRQSLISYINVQLFQEKTTFANILERYVTSGAPQPGTKLSSQGENTGLL